MPSGADGEQREAAAGNRQVLEQMIKLVAVGDVGVGGQGRDDNKNRDRQRRDTGLIADDQRDARNQFKSDHQRHCDRGARFGKPNVMWRGMMGTDGSYDAVCVDRANGKEVRRLPQRARIAWFAYAPDPLCAGKPVKLAERDGVALDREQ